jgi:hypothetical protein
LEFAGTSIGASSKELCFSIKLGANENFLDGSFLVLTTLSGFDGKGTS